MGAAVKAAHRAMWATGDYPALAAEVIPDLGAELVRAAGIGRGQRVLDVAAGAGNAAIAAALAGADVVASDLTPELLDAGRQAAAGVGAKLEWQVADAEALPYADGEFDAVLSCVGAMFAPNHEATAAELVRVCRPGGTIGLLNWTPEGFIGRMFGVLKPYAPPPPPGAQPPPLWGNPEHVQALLGEHVTEAGFRREVLRVDLFEKPGDFRDYFKSRYGPTISVYDRIADDPDKVAALDEALAGLARDHDRGGPTLSMDWEYLLVTARRAG